MPVIQAMQAVVGRTAGGGGPPPPPPPQQSDFFFAGDQDNWMAFGGIYTSGTFSNPAPANPAYAYPDGSYTGKTRDFTGSEWMSSPNLGVGGAWQSNAITIDYWFYPTANNVQLMSESNTAGALNSYHYSVLEIDSSNYVKAKFWQLGTAGSHQIITSTNKVILNQWNHVYFSEDTQGGHTFALNGVNAYGLPTYTRLGPGSGSEYFIIGQADVTYMGSLYPFQGKIGYLTISDYVANSTYANTFGKFQVITTNQSLGQDWTVELVTELQPETFWAALWGNENYGQGSGYLAYLTSTTTLNVGTPAGTDTYLLADDASIKSYWAFTKATGEGIKVYRNGTLLTKTVPNYTYAPPALNTLVIGSRHGNSGVGFTDACLGRYYYTHVEGAAMDQSMITASYNSLKITYGLP